jgi:hypothetical protein
LVSSLSNGKVIVHSRGLQRGGDGVQSKFKGLQDLFKTHCLWEVFREGTVPMQFAAPASDLKAFIYPPASAGLLTCSLETEWWLVGRPPRDAAVGNGTEQDWGAEKADKVREAGTQQEQLMQREKLIHKGRSCYTETAAQASADPPGSAEAAMIFQNYSREARKDPLNRPPHQEGS